MSMTICEHDNGRRELPWEKHQLCGTCIKCGANLDYVRFENWLTLLENRIKKLEKKG